MFPICRRASQTTYEFEVGKYWSGSHFAIWRFRKHLDLDLSEWNRWSQQIPHPQLIVRNRREREHPNLPCESPDAAPCASVRSSSARCGSRPAGCRCNSAWLLAAAVAHQQRIRIGGRLMRWVEPCLAVKINARVPGIVRRRVLLVLAL